MLLKCSKCNTEKEDILICNDARRKSGKSSHCLDCKNAYSTKYRLEHPDRAAKAVRKAQLKFKYGISTDTYSEMLVKQNNFCAVCGEKSNRRLDVDHSHTTGKVRALLCRHCNLGIGNFKDNIFILLKAIDYLKEHN